MFTYSSYPLLTNSTILSHTRTSPDQQIHASPLTTILIHLGVGRGMKAKKEDTFFSLSPIRSSSACHTDWWVVKACGEVSFVAQRHSEDLNMRSWEVQSNEG